MNIQAFNWNNILTDIVPELRKRGHLVEEHRNNTHPSGWENFDVIIMWNESKATGAYEFIKKAKQAGKKTILMQHGRRGTSRIFPPFKELPISDLVCVWGENDKQNLIEAGVSEEKIKITSSPIFSYLKSRVKHSGKNVVFVPEHWDKEVEENLIIANQLKNVKGVNIITKCLENEHNISWYQNPVVSNRMQSNSLEIGAEVLSKADLLVSVSESTFELFAQILNIPVLIADIWQPKACNGDDRYKEYKRIYSNACTREKNIFNIGNKIKEILKNPDKLKNERKNIAIKDGGINIQNPIKVICDEIEKLCLSK